MAKILDENQVKEKLGITEWRQLSKDKMMNFFEILPDVDNEVAIRIIEQLPDFSEKTAQIIDAMKEMYRQALADNKEATTESVKAYESVLDAIKVEMEKGGLTAEEKRYFAEKMIEIANKISEKDSENKNFLLKMLGGAGAFFLAVLWLGIELLKTLSPGDGES